MQAEKPKYTDCELLEKFNSRDIDSLGEIYNLFHLDLNTYAAITYQGFEVDEEDLVHDVFVSLWTAKLTFTTLGGIKAYMITSIKNAFKNYLKHNNYVSQYSETLNNNTEFDINYIESELFSMRKDILASLPSNYIKVMELYLNGYKSGEIAKMLDYSEQTVYNMKNKAIRHLKAKMGNIYILFLFSYCNKYYLGTVFE